MPQLLPIAAGAGGAGAMGASGAAGLAAAQAATSAAALAVPDSPISVQNMYDQTQDFMNPSIPGIEPLADLPGGSAQGTVDLAKQTADEEQMKKRIKRYDRSKTILTQEDLLGTAPVQRKTLLGE